MSRRISSTLLLSMLLASPSFGADDAQKDREKKFAETMSGCMMSGTFSVDGQEKPPQKDSYNIEKVEKVQGDLWTFHTNIKYGENDVKVPITVKVLWAGDTPVITVDNLTIPGLGTFTSRVMIHGDRYAGTWQHDDVGGHMWGKVEKKSSEASSEK